MVCRNTGRAEKEDLRKGGTQSLISIARASPLGIGRAKPFWIGTAADVEEADVEYADDEGADEDGVGVGAVFLMHMYLSSPSPLE